MNTQGTDETKSGQLVSAQEAAGRRLAEHTPAPPPAESTDSAELVAIIRTVARDPNFDVEKLRELRAIHKEWQAEQNEKAFFDALARAQAVMPVVRKNKHVHFPNRDQNKPDTDYWHADYGALVAAVKPVLAAEGLSYRHNVIQEEDGWIVVECVLQGYGHSEKVVMRGKPEGSPGMNEIQKTKSCTTYLKRSTFEAVAGAATEDDDDDGRGAGTQEPLISASQIAYLNAQIDECGAEREGFLKYLGVEALEDLPASEYGKAEYAIEAKRKANAREKGEGAAAEAPAADAAPAEDTSAEAGEPEPHELLGAG